MRFRTMAATTAAASALAVGVAGTSTAATLHTAPTHKVRFGVGRVISHAPDPILRSGMKGMHADSAASCGLENIGVPGNYNYAGYYAGQIEQMWDSCSGVVWAHFQWAGSFQTGPYAGASLQLSVGSPDGGLTDWNDNAGTTASKDLYFDGWNAGGDRYNIVSPDDWRAGAEINNDGCDEWGTLHWYAGQDLDGPEGGCFGHNQFAPFAGQG